MKHITLTEEDKAELIARFSAQLDNTRGIEKISFELKPQTTQAGKHARLNFTAMAWFKMRSLVNHCTTECAWHGIVVPSEDRKTFTVTDILVYPQIVAGATVEQDDTDNAYEIWHQALPTPAYNSLRMQGHSHVNMAANPSGVDTTMYNNMLQTLSANSYYIFMITNKTGNVWVNIYDLLNNIIYENNDVMITVDDIEDYAWFKDMKDNFIKTTTTSSTKDYSDYFGLVGSHRVHDTMDGKDADAFFSAGDGPADRDSGVFDLTGRSYGKSNKTGKRR